MAIESVLSQTLQRCVRASWSISINICVLMIVVPLGCNRPAAAPSDSIASEPTRQQATRSGTDGGQSEPAGGGCSDASEPDQEGDRDELDSIEQSGQQPAAQTAEWAVGPGAEQDSAESDVCGSDALDDAAIKSEVVPDTDSASLRERLLILAPGRPLIVEFDLAIAGVSPTTRMQPLVQQAIAAGDTDGDKITTWDEVLASPRFVYGGFGNMRVTEPQQRRQVKQIYDTDQDGQMDPNEAARFITNDNASGRSLALTGSSHYREIQRRKSAIRLLLDQVEHEDGRLSPAEIESAPQKLARRDADEDAILIWSDLAPSDQLAGNRAMPRSAGLSPAFRLGSAAKFDRILYALKEYYSFGGPLDRRSLSQSPDLFDRLDADADDLIDEVELELLKQIGPDLAIAVHFASPDGEFARPNVDVTHCVIPRFDPSGDAGQGQRHLQFDLPGGKMEVFVRDSVATDFQQRAKSLLAQRDEDGNGYLSEQELPDENNELQAPFLAIDLDQDKMVVPAEITEYLATQQASASNQLFVSVSYTEDALFAVLDRNADGRIAERELLKSPDSLRAFDRNGDGTLELAEIPSSMIIVLGRGRVPQSSVGFGTDRAVVAADESPPRWYQRMDANRDGDVSPREFVGEPAAFQRLDSNEDGFIDAKEASSIEAAP